VPGHPGRHLTVPWLSDARESWLADVRRWVRVWGAVARVGTAGGPLYFKAQGCRARLEPVLVDDLARRWPGLGPDVLAADPERAWLLLADHGTPMSASVDPAGQVAVFAGLMPRYAAVQRESPALIERWIAAGAPDRRVPRLPGLLERLLAGDLWGVAPPLDRDHRRAIDAAFPDLVRVCADAVDHCDLHGGNVLMGRGTPRLVDWGDACVTHPFVSLFVTYQHVVARLPPPDRRAAALRLRDTYLDAWSDLAPVEELREAFGHATWLGYLVRALSFAHMLEPSDATNREAVGRFVIRWARQRALLGRAGDLVEAIAAQTE
jgi:hypothetical protein